MEYKILAFSSLVLASAQPGILSTIAATLTIIVAINTLRKEIISAGGFLQFVRNFFKYKP